MIRLWYFRFFTCCYWKTSPISSSVKIKVKFCITTLWITVFIGWNSFDYIPNDCALYLHDVTWAVAAEFLTQNGKIIQLQSKDFSFFWTSFPIFFDKKSSGCSVISQCCKTSFRISFFLQNEFLPNFALFLASNICYRWFDWME